MKDYSHPKREKDMGIVSGFESHRSPPVLFSETGITDLAVSPFCAGTTPRSIKLDERLDGRHPEYSRLDQHFLHKTSDNGQTDVHHSQRSDGRSDRHHSAQHGRT